MTMTTSHDALFEIFTWLPAKAIYKFKCCSKLFSEFSEETYFALKQAQNALLKDDSCFFIQPSISQRLNCHIELHPLPGEELSSGVSNDVLQFLENYSAKTLASSDGLILCQATTMHQVELFVSNPATQSWFPIPTPEDVKKSIDASLNIVFECDSNDYKVFLFHNPEWSSYMGCQFYSSKEGVWKSREASFFTGARNLRFDMPVCYNGAIHFISQCFPSIHKSSPYFRPYIMSYNFENGMSRMLRVPKEARRGSHDYSCDMGIFKWGKVTSSTQSICLVRLRKPVFTIWVLTNYESSSWRRILKVRVKAMVGLREQNPVVTGYTVMNGEHLVFATEKKVYGYGLTNKIHMRIEVICEHKCESSTVHITSYSNTLRSCGIDARGPLPSCGTEATILLRCPEEETAAITSNLEVVPLISLEEQQHSSFIILFVFFFLFLFVYRCFFHRIPR